MRRCNERCGLVFVITHGERFRSICLNKERRVRLVCASLVMFTTALVAGGCSKKGGMETAPVSGKVTYRGKALPTGTVMFVPDEGPAATGEISSDGSYKLTTFSPGDGAVIGTHKVTITALQGMGNALPEQRSATPPPLVPARYLSGETSGLVAEVKPKTNNEVNFDLKD
jgi:hypothetical protein